MRSKIAFIAPLAVLATAHTENGAGPNQGETMEQYAQRHVRSQFPARSFHANSDYLDGYRAPYVRHIPSG